MQPGGADGRPAPMIRTRAIRGLLAASTAFLVAAVPLSTTLACSCSQATIPDSVGWADVVFTGTAVAVEAPAPGDVINTIDPVHYSFVVDQVFKGPITDSEIVASTQMDGASCGTAFGVDERWLVFANFSEDGISTGLCSGNVLLTDPEVEEAILAELGAPIAEPEPPATETGPVDTGIPMAVPVGGALAAVVIGISAWAFVVEPRRRVR
jgi:hypothetical protein